jgi:hypothetical protein
MLCRQMTERIPRRQACRMLHRNRGRGLWKLLNVRQSATRSKELRTEMRAHKFLHEIVGVFAQEHDDPTDAKYRGIAV